MTGPHSADAMFYEEARRAYDAAICMYHDQALIAAKTLSFSETVNVTLGLAFIRTSPDHGTALDIAGSGKAHPESLGAALRLAAELSRNQQRSMTPIDDLPPLREVIARHGLRAVKSLGQNFLLDLNLTVPYCPRRRRPQRCYGHRNRTRPRWPDTSAAVCRRQAGDRLSSATAAACRRWPRSANVTPVACRLWKPTHWPLDMADLATGPTRVIANLPYNIATPLSRQLAQGRTLASVLSVSHLDVSTRGCRTDRRDARIDEPMVDWRSSTQWRCQPTQLFDVGPRAFTPPPKVWSSLSCIVAPRRSPLPCDTRRCLSALPRRHSANAARCYAKASNRSASDVGEILMQPRISMERNGPKRST